MAVAVGVEVVGAVIVGLFVQEVGPVGVGHDGADEAAGADGGDDRLDDLVGLQLAADDGDGQGAEQGDDTGGDSFGVLEPALIVGAPDGAEADDQDGGEGGATQGRRCVRRSAGRGERR